MKFNQPSLALLPLALLALPATILAAPPLIRWQTIAGPDPSVCGGTDLTSIGFGGEPPQCLSLREDQPTDYRLVYVLDRCTINVFSEAGCADDNLVRNGTFHAPPHPDGRGFCVEVKDGFRALNITCQDA